MLCGRCGQENPEGFAFCGSCGAALDGDEAGQQQRKTVTVVFCDLAGSTALGDSTDPEVLEVRLRRYFERMQTIVERHGGTVEKFIGDAVVAIFGVPVAHEDDALRALRAAAEMRDAMPELELRARIGVNTGEILTSKVGTLVTGDAVNVAARLEQAADAGEVLVGAATRALVGAAAEAAIRSLLGESEQATSVEEIAWAFRKLLGEQAPLVVLVDDIQWGADTFLDLVEHVALLSAAVPLLLVCVARPELLDRRPAWSVAVRLQPLDDDEVGALLGDRVAPGLRAR